MEHGLGLILGPDGIPPWRGGSVGERQEGRGSLCPRGPASLCFDGLPEGFVPAIAGLGGRFLGMAMRGWPVGRTRLPSPVNDGALPPNVEPPRDGEAALLRPP